MGASQNGSRTGRYQPALRSIELNPSTANNNSRYYVQTNPIPQIPTNANLPKSSMAISNGSVDGSIRTKSAHFLARQRTGLFDNMNILFCKIMIHICSLIHFDCFLFTVHLHRNRS